MLKHTHYFIGPVLGVTLSGDLLGLPNEMEINRTVERYSHSGVRQVILNLDGVTHVNSKGLNILIKILTHLDEAHGELVVIKVSDQVKKLFRITKLDMVFKLSESRTEAINWLAKSHSKQE